MNEKHHARRARMSRDFPGVYWTGKPDRVRYFREEIEMRGTTLYCGLGQVQKYD